MALRYIERLDGDLILAEYPDECEKCEWFDADNIFCDKTHDVIWDECVCDKKFKRKE